MALGDRPLGLFFVPTDSQYTCTGRRGRYDITRTHLAFMDARKYRRATTQRLTVVLSGVVFERVVERSQIEGRSMSNLVAYLVERGLDVPHE